jgi:hypothetical protein
LIPVKKTALPIADWQLPIGDKFAPGALSGTPGAIGKRAKPPNFRWTRHCHSGTLATSAVEQVYMNCRRKCEL